MKKHFETLLFNEFMKEENVDSNQAKELSQISSIHFGFQSYSIIKYLLEINTQIQTISVIKRKIDNQWDANPSLEEVLWTKYRNITNLKNEYFNAKMSTKHVALNAYITFRSLPAKEKVLEAYDINPITRLFSRKEAYQHLELL